MEPSFDPDARLGLDDRDRDALGRLRARRHRRLRASAGRRVAAPIQHGVKAGEVSATVVTPDITNATFAACGLQVLDTFDGGSNSPYGYTCTTGLGKSDSPTLQPPPATLFVSPPSTAGLGTVFSYAGIPGGVYLVAFAPTVSAASTSDVLFVVTNGTQVAIPICRRSPSPSTPETRSPPTWSGSRHSAGSTPPSVRRASRDG